MKCQSRLDARVSTSTAADVTGNCTVAWNSDRAVMAECIATHSGQEASSAAGWVVAWLAACASWCGSQSPCTCAACADDAKKISNMLASAKNRSQKG